MKLHHQDHSSIFDQSVKVVIETVKVASAMAFVFLVLVAMGPFTYAVQHVERLF